MRSVLRLVVALCMVAVALMAARSSAQVPIPGPVIPVTPTVISGNDVGFRLEGLRDRMTPVGRLVIRINGQWIEPEFSEAAQPRRLTAK